jgi:hypothetical protein
MPGSEQQQDGEASSAAPVFEGSDEEKEELMQELQQQLDVLIGAHQDELRAAYKQLGLGEPDLSLRGGGNDDSGSSRRKQLTGR